jgi:hypothetical protein
MNVGRQGGGGTMYTHVSKCKNDKRGKGKVMNARCWWLMPIIPVTWEAKIRKIMVGG